VLLQARRQFPRREGYPARSGEASGHEGAVKHPTRDLPQRTAVIRAWVGPIAHPKRRRTPASSRAASGAKGSSSGRRRRRGGAGQPYSRRGEPRSRRECGQRGDRRSTRSCCSVPGQIPRHACTLPARLFHMRRTTLLLPFAGGAGMRPTSGGAPPISSCGRRRPRGRRGATVGRRQSSSRLAFERA